MCEEKIYIIADKEELKQYIIDIARTAFAADANTMAKLLESIENLPLSEYKKEG